MRDSPFIAGIDEAGRGAVAGPVVAAAVILRSEVRKRRHRLPCWSPLLRTLSHVLIADSKLLLPQQRSVSAAWITANAHVGIGIVSAAVIEQQGILWATQRAMQQALGHLRQICEPSSLIVDGRDAFSFAIPHQSIVRGDRLDPRIAAASIMAKTVRDALMLRHHAIDQRYGFDRHKGYGTEKHRFAIEAHGPSAIHRLSFLGAYRAEQAGAEA